MLKAAATKEAARLKRERFELALLFQMKAVGLPIPERQYRFHRSRKWAFDFAFPERQPRTAVEVDGSVYAQGRHTRGKGFEGDLEKFNEAQLLGWAVYRFTTGQVEKGEAVAFLKRVFAEK